MKNEKGTRRLESPCTIPGHRGESGGGGEVGFIDIHVVMPASYEYNPIVGYYLAVYSSAHMAMVY